MEVRMPETVEGSLPRPQPVLLFLRVPYGFEVVSWRVWGAFMEEREEESEKTKRLQRKHIWYRGR